MRWLALVAVLLWPLQAVDEAARTALVPIRTPGVLRVMQAVSDAGKPAFALGALLAVAVFTGPAGPAVAREALVTLAGTNLAVEGLKRATFRARPDGEHKRSNAAFPSSHAANAFALAVTLARRWRRVTLPLVLGAALVAFSRLALDRHWLSDVVVGGALGTTFALLAGAWFDRRRAPAGD